VKLVSIDGRIRALDGPFDAPGTGAIDLAALTGLPAGACRFLGAHGVEAARDKIGRATDIMPIAGVQLDPPIPKPRMIWAVGLNYRAHAAESGHDVPTAPTLFAKSPGALIGHEQPIVIPPHVAQPDYEGEVAVVIGRTTRDVSERDALDYVAGVTCAHDVSSRDHQYTTGQFTWSKSFDTFCPLGPAIATIDEVDVTDLTIETRLNGEIVQSSNTSELVFSIPTLVAWISQGTTLLAGDIILTGTPAGVGAGRKPPRWLLDGDIVEITVGSVGTLRNTVVRKPSVQADR
jgi:2-keto-4-pentenoate hydratase/2-oxohepta-3-ene-1,7-dioic acid hydratase in catechol pathway